MKNSPVILAAAAAALFSAVPASALTLSADYSMLSSSGSVYQNAAGQLFETNTGGLTDVTGLFKTNVSAAFAYLDDAIKVPFSPTITFKLFDFQAAGINADGDSAIDATDVDGRTSLSTIRIDSSAASHFFLDPTPFNNSEYTMTSSNATLGGSSVNVERFGTAVSGGPADGRTDLLTLFLHEAMHSIGLNDGLQRFIDVTGPTGNAGDPDRPMTIPTTLTGFASDFTVPFLAASAHFDANANGGQFAHTVTAEPGFGEGDRVLPAGVEILALCRVNGCTSTQYNLNPLAGPVPEPDTWVLMSAGGLLLLGASRRRRPSAA